MLRNCMLSVFLSAACCLFMTMPDAYAQDRYGLEIGAGMTVTMDDDQDVLRLGSYTYEVWLKDLEGTSGSWRRVFHKGLNNVNTGRGPLLSLRPDDAGMHFSHSTGAGQQTANSIGGLPVDEWVHVALVLTALDGEEIIYQDGVQAATTGGLNLTDTTQEATLVMGNAANVILDDFRIWNYARTEEEIQGGMGQEVVGDEPGLVAYWKFDEGQGDTVLDSSPSEIHGTVAGALWTTDSAPVEPARPPAFAFGETPANGADDVFRTVVLSWKPGTYAETHDVYLGTAFENVNDADAANPSGVLVSEGRTDTSLDVGVLQFNQTYYWRVDEVNGAPDNTVFKGDIWSFTMEPISIPITQLSVTASGSFGVSVAENTINGSGLVDDLHGTLANDMWISTGVPATIEYAFDRAHKLHELWIWNSNQTIESFIGFGAKDVVVEHSLDGENWTVLDGVGPLAQAPGTDGYAHNNTIGFGGVAAQHVRVTINTVRGFAPQTSLSEVRFFSIPTLASRPSPNSGATSVVPDLLLSWGRNGREADRHDVYIGTDADSLSLAGSVQESSFDTLASSLLLGQTYYWQVVEVNEAEDPTEWAGAVWNFTTVDVISVDDMESYKDEEFLEIWATWIDGFDDPGNNGAVVGANPALGNFSPESSIVHGGAQSLPLHYDNSGAPRSEAKRTFDAPMDWTGHSVQGLVLFFQGSPSNTGGSLYVKINDTKVAYDGDASNLMRFGWNKWYISLADVSGTNLSRVTSLTVGIDGGGAGVVYVDDVLLTPDARELITPVEPVGALVAYYPFDGNYQDASGSGLHGSPMSVIPPAFEAGALGQAVSFDGVDQYVEITGYQGIVADRSDPDNPVQLAFSVTCWVNRIGNGSLVCWGSSDGGPVGGQYQNFRFDGGRLRAEHGDGRFRGATTVADGEWHHVAMTVAEGSNLDPPRTQLYVDGIADTEGADTVNSQNVWNVTADADVNIGRRASHGDRYFTGSIDEVRIYDRALSDAEIAWLTGRTEPFDAP